MPTNLLESFNHVLKDSYAMSISALVQLTFYKCNSYWVKQRREANDYIQRGKIWPLTIQIELTMSRDRSRDHTIMLFDSDQHVF
jgi:hypothetical protein